MIIEGKRADDGGVARVESACTVYLSALLLFVSNVVVFEFYY